MPPFAIPVPLFVIAPVDDLAPDSTVTILPGAVNTPALIEAILVPAPTKVVPLVIEPLRIFTLGPPLIVGVRVDKFISPLPPEPPVVLILPTLIAVPAVAPPIIFTLPFAPTPAPPDVTVRAAGRVMVPAPAPAPP